MPDFANDIPDYDLEFDSDIVAASFAYAYHIRLYKLGYNEMSFNEFTVLLKNLPPDCQLSLVIGIRKASGDELQNLTDGQLKIRSDWQEFLSSKINSGEIKSDISTLQNAFKSAYGR